jgi:5-methylcytosine-specific restriction endonuclease McrA
MNKICSTCKQAKSLDEYYKHPGHTDGVQSNCKLCMHVLKEAWRRKNIVKARAYQKQWKIAHPENVKAHNHTHYANLSDTAKKQRQAAGLAWLKAHPESARLQKQRYRQRHAEKVRRERRDFMRRKRQMQPEAARAYERAYRAAHRERFAQRQRLYYLANPARWLAASRLRKARQRAAPFVEYAELDVIFLRDRGICSLCHQTVTRADASRDHIIPVTKGGEESYRNVVLAHKACNSRKGNRVAVQQMRLF